MTESQPRRATTQSEPNRISHIFWRLAEVEMGSVLRDPEWVVKTWLTAVDGLEGRRGGRETAQTALSFLMRLEKDPFYASPEQTRGGDKDASGLVYSLALLLFERLTGHHPFVESLSPLECRIQRDRAKRVGKNNLCHLSSRLRAVLNKALSPFSEDRYVDVAMLRADVERWQRGEMPTLGLDASQPAHFHHSQSTPMPLRSVAQPPPTPRASERFVSADTLQSAVAVRVVPPSDASTAKPLAPWMWPAVSAGFALVAAVALFVAFKSNISSGASEQRAASSVMRDARSPLAASPRPSVQAAPARPAPGDASLQQAIVFEEAEAMDLEEPAINAEQHVVAIVRSCVADSKFRGGLDVGVSVLFDAEGHITRSFTGKLPIERSETACLKAGLEDLVTDDPAHFGMMMRYDLYLSSTSERVRVHFER